MSDQPPFVLDLVDAGAAVTVTYSCPMCGWVHHMPATALADRQGLQVKLEEIIERASELLHGARAIERHLATHSPMDWADRVGQLYSLLRERGP